VRQGGKVMKMRAFSPLPKGVGFLWKLHLHGQRMLDPVRQVLMNLLNSNEVMPKLINSPVFAASR
jgi:hypothetical protein